MLEISRETGNNEFHHKIGAIWEYLDEQWEEQKRIQAIAFTTGGALRYEKQPMRINEDGYNQCKHEYISVFHGQDTCKKCGLIKPL